MQAKSKGVVVATPALASLGLTADELGALRRQGFVCREDRGRGRVYAKLRYRIHGRQHVRYLGKDEAFIHQVEQELAQLQAVIQLDRALGKLAREASRVLRSVKPKVESLLNENGYGFHGLAVRKPRANSQ